MSVLETFDEQLLFLTQTQNSSDIITLLPETGPSGADNIALLLLDERLSELSAGSKPIDIGTHSIVLQVSDGKGGKMCLKAIVPPANNEHY